MNQAETVPARIRKVFSEFHSRFHPSQPPAELIPETSVTVPSPGTTGEEEEDEFQRQQTAKLVKIFHRLKSSGGTTEVEGIHIIPSGPMGSVENKK